MNQMETIRDGRSVRAEGKRRARREEILRAAERVISEKGYQVTSVADVIHAAGVSRGTFYLYFPSREALFHELIDLFIQRLMSCIRVIRIEDGDPIGQLYENVRRVVDLLFDNPNVTVILWREAVGQDERVHRKLNAFNAFLHRMVARALKNGADWGLIRRVNEKTVAMAIIGSLKEILYNYLVVNGESIPDRQELTGDLLDFGLRGLQVPS
jgi:AcrR family transcriptional regulator